MNHYKLPDGNVQIAFSGGRTSGYMLHHILEANGGLPDRCKVVFSNTGREMPETIDFVQECSDRWSVPIVWVEDTREDGIFETVSHNSASRNGEPFRALIERRKYLPNSQQRFCTTDLKYLPARRYAMSIGWKRWFNTLGIRADEAHRATPSTDDRIDRWFPLVDANVSKKDVMDFWKRQPFDLLVEPGLGNCDGCFLKSEATLAALARDKPERHKWWEDMEALVADLTLGNGGTFHKGFSRRELRTMVERQGDWLFDTEGALCQADGGECTG